MSVFVNRHGAGRVRLAGGGRPGWAVTWLGLAGGQVTRGRVCWGTARSWLTGLTGLVGAAGGWSEPGMGFGGGVPG